VHHIHGRPNGIRKVIEILGFTFDSVSDFLSNLVKDNQLYCSMDQKGPDGSGGVLSLKRAMWQVKAFLIMHTNVPTSKAIEWCKSLPDDEEFYQVSMTLPTHDHGGMFGGNGQTCWLALVHEKLGLYDGALRFCRLALEQDLLKAGVPHTKWTQVIAAACQGRVLTTLNQHSEALVAFGNAISTSEKSFPMMKAFAFRELANCDAIAGVPAAVAEAAAQARRDLKAKLNAFEGRLTCAEFDTLTIAPPLAPVSEGSKK
jgi:hypothetical protein